VYDGAVLCRDGEHQLEREDARARIAYVTAAERFTAAMRDFVAVCVPIVARGSGRELPGWGRAEIAVVLELQAALAELITTRRVYDRVRHD
jgi:hypothetical protein